MYYQFNENSFWIFSGKFFLWNQSIWLIIQTWTSPWKIFQNLYLTHFQIKIYICSELWISFLELWPRASSLSWIWGTIQAYQQGRCSGSSIMISAIKKKNWCIKKKWIPIYLFISKNDLISSNILIIHPRIFRTHRRER